MPTGLPTTRPRNTPRNTADGSDKASPRSSTPALARANSGTITKLVHGCKQVDQPVTGRYRSADRPGDLAHVGGVEIGPVGQHVDDLVGFERRLPRDSRRQQPHDDTGDRGVHAGFVDHQPQHEPERRAKIGGVGDVEPADDGDDRRRSPRRRRGTRTSMSDG